MYILNCRRGYTAARYARIIDNIRRYMPDASVSGDAIVGQHLRFMMFVGVAYARRLSARMD